MICVKKAELAGHLHADCSLEVAHVLPLFLFLFIMLALLFLSVIYTRDDLPNPSWKEHACSYGRQMSSYLFNHL
jgi:hypothetical protein